MKNYYEILEIDKNASAEIIKVAYKSLVKKYHPDLKEGSDKTKAEEKIKEINDAYDVLSDPVKKEEYDRNLIKENISLEQYNLILNENTNLKKELDYLKRNFYKNNINTKYDNFSESQNNNYTQQKNNSNINYNNNLGEKLKTIIAICLTFLIIFIIFQIPFVNKFILDILGSGYLIIIILVIVFYIYYFRNKH